MKNILDGKGAIMREPIGSDMEAFAKLVRISTSLEAEEAFAKAESSYSGVAFNEIPAYVRAWRNWKIAPERTRNAVAKDVLAALGQDLSLYTVKEAPVTQVPTSTLLSELGSETEGNEEQSE